MYALNSSAGTPSPSAIHLPLPTGSEYTQRNTHVITHTNVQHHTLKPNLEDLCGRLLSCLTTSSQVRNLVNNSLYLPAPLFKIYNVCIAAQVNE